MTPEQISAHFKALRDISNAVAGAELKDKERAVIQAGLDSVLQIVESVILDINRIANALERSN